MVDFLKAFPFVTMEDYKWNLSVPMIRLMSTDNTRIHYISEETKKKRAASKKAINSAADLLSDFGLSESDIANLK